MEAVTIIVMPRDHFSTMEKCLDAVFENTPKPFDLWVFSGGTPEAVKKRWEERYAGRVQFTYFPDFKNGAELRNIALKKTTTRLAVLLDSDVYVRTGWLEPMVRCQQETGAAMVTPVILDRDDRIHTAGNDFLVTKKNGETFASMELRFQHHKIVGPTNLARQETAFCEMHCQLVLVETAKRFDIFDPNLREFQEMDAGLTLTKQGCKMMFEPQATVYLFYETLIGNAEDLRLHMWKWDMPAMHDGFAYFKKKWGWNINQGGVFDKYLRAVNRRVGFFSRRWPSALSTQLDRIRSGSAKRSRTGP